MLTTVLICTVSMLIMLVVGLPLAYILAFRVRRATNCSCC